VTGDNQPNDLELIGRDVAEASKAISGALQDVEDIERDSVGWPEGGVVAYQAGEARSALEALSAVLDASFEATDPKENR
jgi:hypothetical protein